MLATGLIFTFLLNSIVNATPNGPDSELVQLFKKQGGITLLSETEIEAFKPFTHFASTTYCDPSTTINWSCGSNCQANPDFIPTGSGGDDSVVQNWYVGYSPSLESVIVAHEGTDYAKIPADLTDLDIPLKTLDPTLFPGIDSSVQAHSGFANEHAKTATQILAAVQATMAAHGTNLVVVVGQSLGAATSLLDGVYLPLHIPGISVKVIGYGMPRVGNQAFADYVDAHLPGNVKRINNKKDFIPILPARFMGFQHPSGELHIMDNNQWVSCSGQENASPECTDGEVPSIFQGKLSDHDGPYDGIMMDC